MVHHSTRTNRVGMSSLSTRGGLASSSNQRCVKLLASEALPVRLAVQGIGGSFMPMLKPAASPRSAAHVPAALANPFSEWVRVETPFACRLSTELKVLISSLMCRLM